MKDYASMSDQEINQLIGTLISRDGLSIIASDGNAVIHEYSDCGDFKGICLGWKVFDPCNNPADAWPILLENNISLVKWQHDDVWAAWSGVGMAYGEVECEYVEHDENPLRAGMIVFLMMKESENDS